MRCTSSARRLTAVRQPAPAGEKRDLILKAATKVFAQNGYFQSQVADVARVAGVAAGTVYLYFKSKDDLLVSIFERSMNEVLGEGRAAIAGIADPAERLRKLAHLHLERLGRDKDLAVVFQVELRQSVKFMERFSETFLQDYFRLIRQAIADGQQSGAFRKDISATTADEDLLRRPRRDGHQLGAEPPQVRPQRRSRCGRRPFHQWSQTPVMPHR